MISRLRSSGFGVVAILLLIVSLALGAALVLVRVDPSNDSAAHRLSAKRAEAIFAGMRQYALDHGGYPIMMGSGALHSCAVDSRTSLGTNSNVKCWGYSNVLQLGTTFVTAKPSPTQIADAGTTYSAVSSGIYHTCGITSSGVLKCWGGNASSQLGDGTTTNRTPTVIDSGVTYSAVSAGGISYTASHTCGITSSGALKCWGYNAFGQVGDGTTTDRTTPTLINSGTSYSLISAGANHACGITTANALKCWGSNTFGRLGDGTTTNRSTPTAIDSSNKYSAIAAGYYHTCGILSSGVLKCWGLASSGQVGRGTTASIFAPDVVDSGVTYSAVAAGGQHSCGVTSTGVLKCWGYNGYGQVGDGTTTDRLSPTVVDSGVTYAPLVATGIYQSFAVTTTGQLKAWGRNGNNQLGDRTAIDKTTPIRIILGDLPPAMTSLVTDEGIGCSSFRHPLDYFDVALRQGWCGPYVDQEFSGDPNAWMRDGWGKSYIYSSTAETLISYGPNLSSGGGDDVTFSR